MTIKVGFVVWLCLFFIGFCVTVFYLKKFGGEGDVYLKGLIFAGALGNLVGLKPLFPKVGKGGPDNFFLLLLVEYIDDQRQLKMPHFLP